jgi:hypothetical protein
MSAAWPPIVRTDAAPRRRNQAAPHSRITAERAGPDASQPERAPRPILVRRVKEADTVGRVVFDELMKFTARPVSVNVIFAAILERIQLNPRSNGPLISLTPIFILSVDIYQFY